MRLDGSLYGKVLQVLINAFPRRTDMAIMVRTGLGENLNVIAGGDSLRDIVYSLLEWSESRNLTVELIAGACRSNPTNWQLNALYNEILDKLKESQEQVRIQKFRPDNLIQGSEHPTIQFQNSHYKNWNGQIMKLSFDLPGARFAIEQELQRIERLDGVIESEQFFDQHFKQLVHRCLTVKFLPDYVMDHVPLRVEEALSILASMRRFTTHEVAPLLAKYGSLFPSPIELPEAQNIIGDLEKTSWVSYDKIRRAYTIKEPLRKIIALSMKVRDAQLYLQIHKDVMELCLDRINKFADSRIDYIKEYVFHHTNVMNLEVMHLEKKTDINATLCDNLENWIKRFYSNKSSDIDLRYLFLYDNEWQDELEGISPGISHALRHTIEQHLL